MRGELRSYVSDYIQDQMINLELTISARSKTRSTNASLNALAVPPHQPSVSLQVPSLWDSNRYATTGEMDSQGERDEHVSDNKRDDHQPHTDNPTDLPHQLVVSGV